MKKNLFKSAAVLLMVVFIIASFAACSSDNKVSSEQNSSVTDSVSTGTEVAEFVELYNNALAKGSVKCTSSQQKVEKGNLWIGDNSDETMDLTAPEQAELLAKFEKSETTGIELPKLAAENVESVSVNENVVVYKLKMVKLSDAVEQGQGGYLNIVDTNGTQALVEGVKSYANVKGNVKINSSEFELSEGTITVTYKNKKHKQIESVSFSAKQNVKAEMKYLVIAINADIVYNLTSEYTGS